MMDETTYVMTNGPTFAGADEHGEFAPADVERIAAPEGLDATFSLIEQADGWRFGVVANLPAESLSTPLSALSDPLPSRDAALHAAYKDLSDWASNQVLLPDRTIGTKGKKQMSRERSQHAKRSGL